MTPLRSPKSRRKTLTRSSSSLSSLDYDEDYKEKRLGQIACIIKYACIALLTFAFCTDRRPAEDVPQESNSDRSNLRKLASTPGVESPRSDPGYCGTCQYPGANLSCNEKMLWAAAHRDVGREEWMQKNRQHCVDSVAAAYSSTGPAWGVSRAAVDEERAAATVKQAAADLIAAEKQKAADKQAAADRQRARDLKAKADKEASAARQRDRDLKAKEEKEAAAKDEAAAAEAVESTVSKETTV